VPLLAALYLFMKYVILVALIFSLVGCFSGTSNAPKLSFNYSELPIKLEEHVDGNWDRVCFLGPYSNNEAAKELIGLDWPLESLSSVWVNDGVTLLVFLNNGAVVSFYEVSRHPLDFSSLSNTCVKRNSSTFTKNGSQVVQTKV
jgi:hypothetical protein